MDCDGDCNVTLWIKTRSVKTYNYSFCLSEYFICFDECVVPIQCKHITTQTEQYTPIFCISSFVVFIHFALNHTDFRINILNNK